MKGIYLITNLVNNKKYVGLSNNINRRFTEHKTPKNIANKNTVLSKAFRKYNIDNFIFEILEIVDDIEMLGKREMFWIEKIKPEYNMNKGGKGNLGFSQSQDIKDLLRLAGKLQWESKTESDKNKIISNNLTGPKKGHLVSLETRIKLREKNIGKKLSKSTKDKIGLSNKKSMIGNKNGNKNVIAFNNFSEIKFNSIVEASKYLNCHPSNISNILKGKQRSVKGYFFKYEV